MLMRILQINSVCGILSTGRITTDLHSILLADGHESTVAFGRKSAKNCSNSIRIGNDFDNFLHILKTRIFDEHGFGSVAATRKFIRQIIELDPDVIHLHNLHGYFINVELLFDYLKSANKPVIWTMHDCWSFTGHCAYFDMVGCDRWKNHCHQCPQIGEYPKSLIDHSSFNSVSYTHLTLPTILRV